MSKLQNFKDWFIMIYVGTTMYGCNCCCPRKPGGPLTRKELREIAKINKDLQKNNTNRRKRRKYRRKKI